ncbi:hypothetical protein HELRODRAFT_175531 [Helobdella robusta]|uniref:G-protein coupled receptors family 1 profile domain-containing protein n=1 Tax=Helobdella robusta TaxID=6412 RepID=T1F9D0_HELRO|nr:hypothetical protein HELRODRAFT_175531 [Helobdella robusta]ESO00570.1 hypothetical protein HELRODRAFT_175531 [Helobdella robusta]
MDLRNMTQLYLLGDIFNDTNNNYTTNNDNNNNNNINNNNNNNNFNVTNSHNERNDTYEYEYICSIYDFVTEGVIMAIFCIFGFVGNITSMFCLWRDKSKTATPLLLINLEVADTLFLVTVLLIRVTTTFHSFIFHSDDHNQPDWFLDIGIFIFPSARFFETCAVYSTILVTVNRYIAVCIPFRANSLCSVVQAKKQIFVVWCLCFLYNFPLFFAYRRNNYGNGLNEQFGGWFKILYNNVLYFIIMFLIPLALLLFLNCNLVVVLRKTHKKRELLKRRVTKVVAARNERSSITSAARSEDDITLMLIVVVIIFIITQTPALFTQILKNVNEARGAEEEEDDNSFCPNAHFFFERISDLLVVCNSSVNFIIYCFCSARFRKILFGLLKIRTKNDVESTTAAAPDALMMTSNNKKVKHNFANSSKVANNNHTNKNNKLDESEEGYIDDNQLLTNTTKLPNHNDTLDVVIANDV